VGSRACGWGIMLQISTEAGSKIVNQGDKFVATSFILQDRCHIAENVRLFNGQFVDVSFVFIHIPASNVINRYLQGSTTPRN
jgi:hypothetical protein